MPRDKKDFESMRDATKAKIDSAAIKLFAQKGLSVTIDEIAKEATISKGLLYNHYKSKEALIIELATTATQISGQSIKALSDSQDTALNKINLITQMMNDMIKTRHFGINSFMFMIQVGMTDFPLPKEASYSADIPNPIDSLAKIVAKGQAEGTVVEGDPLCLAIAYWATIQGMCCYSSAKMQATTTNKILNRILIKDEYNTDF